ncbi:MAG: gamma-glutamyltransferase, partial [Chloroflexota bacterium]|nr:gamma-glutamyltransferase [Chloroflexota bacterium]
MEPNERPGGIGRGGFQTRPQPAMNRHRPSVMAANGLVASGHPLASAAGIRVMQEGGNAFDAAIAAAAVAAVCKPSMNSIGGDNMALIWDARRQQLLALNSNGYSPAAATLDRCRGGIPLRGPMAVSVPGAVAGWEAIIARFGTKTLGELLGPAIGYAEHGFPVGHQLLGEMRGVENELRSWPGAAGIFLPGGRLPGPTDLLPQVDLAASLRALAAHGARALYDGELAQRIGEHVAASGGILAAADLAGFHSQWKEAVRTSYRDAEFYGQPPSSQGFIVAQELNILEGFEPRSMGTAELIHTMVEAKKLAFADRDRYLADPEHYPVPLQELVSKEHAARQRERIDPGRAAQGPRALPIGQAGGETTYLCAVDRDGNAISLIQSIFHVFGSCFVAGDTGILLNNRMTAFNVEAGHPNCVEPGKRPAMTLNACMLFRDGRPWVVYGTPGADAQVQTNFQMAVNFVDFGMDVQSAAEAPRWRHFAENLLAIDDRCGRDAIERLSELGHDVDVRGPWGAESGSVKAIMVDQRTGVLQGGADPRRDGYA